MSDPRDRFPAYTQCDGKERFESAALAHRVARRRTTNKRLRVKGRDWPLEKYLCRHCGFYHVGGQGK
jgi:hypothetical protein